MISFVTKNIVIKAGWKIDVNFFPPLNTWVGSYTNSTCLLRYADKCLLLISNPLGKYDNQQSCLFIYLFLQLDKLKIEKAFTYFYLCMYVSVHKQQSTLY